MKKLLKKIARRILKDEILAMRIPKPEAIIIPPKDFKRYRAQRIVPYTEHLFYLYEDIEKMVHYKQHFNGKTVYCNCDDAENREGEYIKAFRFDIANELLNEINIKKEDVPEGVMYSVDLLFKCV